MFLSGRKQESTELWKQMNKRTHIHAPHAYTCTKTFIQTKLMLKLDMATSVVSVIESRVSQV